MYETACAEGTDFDLLLETYNDDAAMDSSGMLISRSEAASSNYLSTLFDLAPGEVGGIYRALDGYYIIRRETATAADFEENRDMVFQNAVDQYFADLLAQWKANTTIKTTSVYDDITVENHLSYVK